MARYGWDYGGVRRVPRRPGRDPGRGGRAYDVDYEAGRWESPGWRVPGQTPAGREGLGPSVFGTERKRGYPRGYGRDYRGIASLRGNPLIRRIREDNADLVADYLREEGRRR